MNATDDRPSCSAPDAPEPASTRWWTGWPVLSAGAAAGAVAALLHWAPAVGTSILGGGTARIAGLLVGSPVVVHERGFALPAAAVPVLVTEACRASDFLILAAAVLGWHFGARRRTRAIAVLLAVVASIPVAVFTNALRVAALTQAHRWLLPHFPASYHAFLHLLVGVAVFLPALIALNLVLERHDRRPSATRC